MAYLFSTVSLTDVLSTLGQMTLIPFLIFVALSFTQTFFRSWRYLILLKANEIKVPGTTMFLVTIVRNFFSDLLPARIGTLSYVYILTSRLGITLDKALPSFTVAFIFDLIAIVPLLLIATFSVNRQILGQLQLLLPLSLALLIILLIILHFLPNLFRLAARTIKKISFLVKFSDKLEKTSQEIAVIKNSGVYLKTFILSLLVRICKYGGYYFLLLSLLTRQGYGLREIGLGRFFLGICGAEFSASLPISGIAGFGAYEGTWAFLFSLLGFPQKLAIITGISHHLITQVYGYALGAICLLLLLLPVFKARNYSLDSA